MASELLKRANELIKNKVHPTQVMTGFKKAAREACDYITVHLPHILTNHLKLKFITEKFNRGCQRFEQRGFS